MNYKLENKLVEKYHEFFDYLKENTDSNMIVPMMFGFECNDGWYNILDTLLDTIHKYCEYNKVTYPMFTSIKEKYGRLSINIAGGDDIIFGMIWYAEYLSSYTCEICGSMKDVGQTEGWIYTMCETCYASENTHTNHKNLKFNKYEN
jgi:hypothetical protein